MFVPGLGPAIQVSGVVKLTVNPSPLVIQLTFSGQMTVIELGTLGATAGDFILDLGPSGPNLWGVATVSASYPGLVAAGIILTASGTLEINTSSQVQNVTLQLPTGAGGAEQAAPYTLQPTSLEIAVTGQAALRPPGTSTDLLDLTGGFYIGINPQGLQIYAVATLSVGGVQLGQATGLIIISSGKGVPGIPGIAGLLTVGGSASLGLPDVGSLFSITGTATVMFNTTLADQTFQIPAEFLALQPAGDPTTVTVYGAAPALTGQPDVGRGAVHICLDHDQRAADDRRRDHLHGLHPDRGGRRVPGRRARDQWCGLGVDLVPRIAHRADQPVRVRRRADRGRGSSAASS